MTAAQAQSPENDGKDNIFQRPGEVEPQVLVIEDNPDMRAFLRRVLEHQCCSVMEAADGTGGISMAREHQPSLILMDLSLPDQDGLEAIKRLKSDPLTRDIPVVAVTARAHPVDEIRALDAGCDGYLNKPYSLREFIELVNRFLKRDPVD